MEELTERLRKVAKLEAEDYGAEPRQHVNWEAADMLETQAAKIQQMAVEYISEQGQWIDEIGRLKGEVARYETLCDQLGEALHAASYALTYDVPKVEVALAAWREFK